MSKSAGEEAGSVTKGDMEKKDDMSISSDNFHSDYLDSTNKIPSKSNHEQYIDYRETSKTLMYLMGESKI